MRRLGLLRVPAFGTSRRRVSHRSKAPRRGSRSGSRGRRGPGKRRKRLGRIESLEDRCLFSAATVLESTHGVFRASGQTQEAVFEYAFEGTPTIQRVNGGVLVTLADESTWVSTGDPVVPVRGSTILLPPGSQIVSASVSYLDEGVILGVGEPLLAAPAAIPTGGSLDQVDWSTWTAVVSSSLTAHDAVEFATESVAGYELGILRVFPVEYDAARGTLIYHSRISVTVTTGSAASGSGIAVRDEDADRQRVAAMVENPGQMEAYATASVAVAAASTPAASLSRAEYVIITSNALAGAFQPLLAEKISRGLTAALVTTEFIYANYSGTENHDNADKIRHYIADAYAHQGTRWVLLGGGSQIIPVRGVYGAVGGAVDNNIPCDLYYAALDGTWDGDGDGIWGEANDGLGGGDVDLGTEVYIGRAPANNLSEAANFVAKTVRYDTVPVANATTALWLGERLDSQTQGSTSSELIRQQTIPSSWNVITQYDTSSSQWTAAQLIAALNAGPNLVNHLGHSSDTRNARLTVSDMAALTNVDPYFLYSQGCDAGSFDTQDPCIGAAQVVSAHGAFGVVMNSRYGWYVPGSNPGGSHDFALSFWDGVLNQGKLHLGEANQYSKDANRFRVQATGMARWIAMETNLLGDPETSFQLGTNPPAGRSGQIQGTVFDDADADGVRDAGEAGLAGQTVYLDSNNNGRWDNGTVTTVSSTVRQNIPDNGTLAATLAVSGVATIADVTVTLNITHSFDSDLEAYLISPAGTRIVLFSRVGDWGQNFTGTTLDDDAAMSIADAAAPFSGTFRPQGRLALLEGQDPNGIWTLEIADKMVCDAGSLDNWSLTFTSSELSTQTASDGSYSFDNLAAQTYRVRVLPSSGWTATSASDALRHATVPGGGTVRHVDFALSNGAQPQAVDLGTVDYLQRDNVALNAGQTWYCVRATRSGYLTIEAIPQGSSSVVNMQLYGGTRNAPLATAAGNRIDYQVVAGEVYYFSLSGSGNVALRLANLVRQSGSSLIVDGTGGNDRFQLTVGPSYELSMNGVAYSFASGTVSAIRFDGGAGYDTAAITGSSSAETATLRPGAATLAGPGYQVDVANAENIVLAGGGGNDDASLYDSAAADTFYATPQYATLSGDGFFHRVESFKTVNAFSSGGSDVAYLYGSAGSDTLVAKPNDAEFRGWNYGYRAGGFAEVFAYGSGGMDTAILYDSPGNDLLVASPGRADLSGDRFRNHVAGFFAVHAYAVFGGYDVAQLQDSPGNDVFVATPGSARLYGSQFTLRAKYFDAVFAYATAGGRDSAVFHGSTGDDAFVGTPDCSSMSGAGYLQRAKYFESVSAYGCGGDDRATLYDSPADDRLEAAANWLKMSYPAASIQAADFSRAQAVSSNGGNDVRQLETLHFLLETLGTWLDA